MTDQYGLTQIITSIVIVAAAIGGAGKWAFVTKKGLKDALENANLLVQKDITHIKEIVANGDRTRQEQIRKRDAMDQKILLHMGRVDEHIRTCNNISQK